MNLSTLHEMIRQGDVSLSALRFLLSCKTECEHLDFKEQFTLENEADICEFVRDALGMKNIGGGYIVIGVRDKTWEPLGMSKPLNYDTKMLRDKIQKAARVDIDIDLVNHRMEIAGMERLFSAIFIRSSTKRSKLRVPTIAKHDYGGKCKHPIRKGDIYIRRGDETVKLTDENELADILDDLEERTNRSRAEEETRNPFAVSEGLYRLLDKGYETFIGRESAKKILLNAVFGDPRIWIINVHGPGGVGKTALVNWLVYELFATRKYEAILQLSAKESMLTEKGIRSQARSLYSLEDLLDHILSLFEESTEGETDTKTTTALEILKAWKILLVLDNMETVQDGRVIDFIRQIPNGSQSRVVMTSRMKTGGWELPIPLNEMNLPETREFIGIKACEKHIDFPVDDGTIARVHNATGGLPLAVQWTIGQFSRTKDIESVLRLVARGDSPVLEFSFRNIWNVLSKESKRVLAIFPIFEESPSAKDLAVALHTTIEAVEESLTELIDCTLVNRVLGEGGAVSYAILPITQSFAANQLKQMGNFEIECQQRYQKYSSQLLLHESEVQKFVGFFRNYGVTNENEKRAIILIRRAESDAYFGNIDSADQFIKDATDLSPNSAVVNCLIASYQLERKRLAGAVSHILAAEKTKTKANGKLIYSTMYRVYDTMRDRQGTLRALRGELEYDPRDNVVKHQLGVALSRIGNTKEAISIFTEIIEDEKAKATPTDTLILALSTRILNLKRLGLCEEAKQDIQWILDIVEAYPYFGTIVDRDDYVAQLHRM